jgi:hypothetical protein
MRMSRIPGEPFSQDVPDAHHHAAALPDLAEDTQRRPGTAFIIAHDPVKQEGQRCRWPGAPRGYAASQEPTSR